MSKSSDPFAGMASMDIDVDKWLQETEEKTENNRRQGGESEYISLDDFALRMQNEDAPNTSQNTPRDMPTATSSFSRGQDMVYKCSFCDYKNVNEYAMLFHSTQLHVDEEFNNTMFNIDKTAAKWDESISLGADVHSNAKHVTTPHDSDSDDDGMHIMNQRGDKSKSNNLSSKSTSRSESVAGSLNSASGGNSETSTKAADHSLQERTTPSGNFSPSPAVSNSNSASLTLHHRAIRNAVGANTGSGDSGTTPRDDIPMFDLQLPTPPALLPDNSSDGRSVVGDFDTPKNKTNAEKHRSVNSQTVQTSATSGGAEKSARVSLPEKSGRIPMAVALTPSWVSNPPASNASSFLASKTISSQPHTTCVPKPSSQPHTACVPKPVIPSPPPLISQPKSGSGFVPNLSGTTTGAQEQTRASSVGILPGMLPNWPAQNQTSSASNFLKRMVQSNQTSFSSQRRSPLGQTQFIVENAMQAHARTSPATTASNMPVRYAPPAAHQQNTRVNGQSFSVLQPQQGPSIPTQDHSTITQFIHQQAMRTRIANSQHPPIASQNTLMQQLRNQAPQPHGQAQVTRQQPQGPRHLNPSQVAQNVQIQGQRQAQASNQPMPQSAYQFHFHTNQNKPNQSTNAGQQRPSILRHNRNQNTGSAQLRHPVPVSQPNLPTSRNNPRFQQMAQNLGSQNVFRQGQVTNLSNININNFNQAVLQATKSTPQSPIQNQVLFQQALLQSTVTSSTLSNNVASANLFGGGGAMVMATSNAQVRAVNTSTQQQQAAAQQRNGSVTARQLNSTGQASRFTVSQLGGQSHQVHPNRSLTVNQIISPGATGSNFPPNFATGQKVNPQGGGDIQGQDGKLYMMKPIGQGFVLTPYGNEKAIAQIPAPTGTGSTTRININLLQNVKDSVADPTLLAFLNGKEVPKNVKFKCKLCSSKTDSLNMIRWHLYAHHLQSAPRPFKCEKCTESFFSEKHAFNHAREVHHTQKCHTFDESITQIAQKHSATMFKVYAAIVMDEAEDEAKPQNTRMFSECQICLLRMQDLKSMRSHMENLHNPFKSAGFQCWYCPECSNNEETMKEHVKKVHVNQPSQYTRDQPPGKKREKITSRLMDFSKQVPFAPNPIKSFSITENQPENAEETELITCPLCTFVSVQTVSLENHLKNDHLPFKPYLCHGNDYKAATIKMLKKHLAQKHIEWLQSGSLHKRVSIDGELSACQDRETIRLVQKALQKGLENAIDFCSAGLIQFDNTCSECQYKASTHTMLETHIKLRHITPTPHICQLCGVATALRESIRNHIRKKHPTEKPDNVMFTDEAGERLQEGETMKIVIKSICINSDDQDEETPLEPDLPTAESNKDKSHFENTADAVATEAPTPEVADEVPTAVQVMSTAPGQPVTNLTLSSVATSVHPVVTSSMQPLTSLPAPPVVITGQLPLATQPLLQSPMLILPMVSIPQLSTLSVLPATQAAPVVPISTTTSMSGTSTSTSDEMISAAVGMVRVKTEPGLEEQNRQPGVEATSSESLRTRLSEFFSTRSTRGQEQSSIDNVTSAQSRLRVPLVTITNSPLNPAPVTVVDTVGAIPVAASREIPNGSVARSVADEETVEDNQALSGGQKERNVSGTEKDQPMDSSVESCLEKQTTGPSTDLSRSVDNQLGGSKTSVVSVRTDDQTNVVVLSIPDTSDRESNVAGALDSLTNPSAAQSTTSNTSLTTSVTGAAKNIPETVSKSKAVSEKSAQGSTIGNVQNVASPIDQSKPAEIPIVDDMSKITSLFTGEQMKAPAVRSSPISSPSTPDVQKAFKCHKCEEVFPKFVEVRQHCITSHFSEYWPFYCEKCDFRTWNHPLMRIHMRDVHNSSDFVKSDRKRQELLSAELKGMQNLVKTVLVPKKTGADDSKKSVACTGRMLSTKDLSMGDIKKRLQFRNQKSKSKDASKDGQGSKSPIINPTVLNAPLDRLHSIEKGTSEEADFVGTCFKCQRYTQGSLVEVSIPLIHVTVVNEKECLFRCDCDYTSTQIPKIVFHLWCHTALNLYHCGLCMAEGNEKKEIATHCLTKHNQEVGLHSIRLFKSIVKLLEKQIEAVSTTLQEYHRKRPVITSPENYHQTLDITKALYKCSYCVYQRSSLLEVIDHEQDFHTINLVKIELDFRASLDNGLTERLHRRTFQKPTVTPPAAGVSREKPKKVETAVPASGEGSNQAGKKGDKSASEKHVMMKINLQKGKRKAVILSDSEESSSSEEKKPTPAKKKRRGSLPRESKYKECHLCIYTTEIEKDLETHLLSKHTTIRPYGCSNCKKVYLLKEDARNHIHRRHPNVATKLVIIPQMVAIMNEARLQMMKYAREKQLGVSSSSQSDGVRGRPKTLDEYAVQFKDPKLTMKPVVKLKDVTTTKRYKKYMKRKRKHLK